MTFLEIGAQCGFDQGGEAHAVVDAALVMPLPPGGRYVVAVLDAEHDATAAASVTVLAEPVSVDIVL